MKRSKNLRNVRNARRFTAVEQLDPRLMMHSGSILGDIPLELMKDGDAAFQPAEVVDMREALDFSRNVPALNSNPDAAATLYLDFDGNFEAGSWTNSRGTYRNISTPAFDLDGTPETFSLQERLIIRDAWATVAEDFAPFDINVTTVAPESFENGEALRIAIGGHDNDWYKATGTPSGTSTFDSFTNAEPNLAFVFSEAIGINNRTNLEYATALGNVISHEAGHSFGLEHARDFDASGVLVNEYSVGDAETTPIMGNSFQTDRVNWQRFTTEDARTFQDPMAGIASDANGFGYRADDHSNQAADATVLDLGGAAGIIEQTSDRDVFVFNAMTGSYSFELNVAEVSPNLDAKLEIFHNGRLIAQSDPENEPGASIGKLSLGFGTYYVAVSSHGDYGDVGQYSLDVSGTPFGFAGYENSVDLDFGPDYTFDGEKLPEWNQPVPVWDKVQESKFVEEKVYLVGIDMIDPEPILKGMDASGEPTGEITPVRLDKIDSEPILKGVDGELELWGVGPGIDESKDSSGEITPTRLDKIDSEPILKGVDGELELWGVGPGIDESKDSSGEITPVRLDKIDSEPILKGVDGELELWGVGPGIDESKDSTGEITPVRLDKIDSEPILKGVDGDLELWGIGPGIDESKDSTGEITPVRLDKIDSEPILKGVDGELELWGVGPGIDELEPYVEDFAGLIDEFSAKLMVDATDTLFAKFGA